MVGIPQSNPKKDSYSKPSAKAPVIHPGDEAPCLCGEAGALCGLTAGSRFARI
jgi:hypothetical protein